MKKKVFNIINVRQYDQYDNDDRIWIINQRLSIIFNIS